MGAIRNLVVKLSADVAELQKGLDKGAAQTRKFRREVEGNFSSVKKSFASIQTAAGYLGIALGGSAIVGAIKHQVELADELAEVSRQLDVNVESFSLLVGIAKRSNVEMAELEQVMRKVADSAASGNKAFSALGIDAQKLAKLPIDQQLRTLIDALNQLSNASDKIKIAGDIGGTRASGQILQLANAFKEGATQAQKYFDTVTAGEARAAQNASDFFDTVGAAIGKVARFSATLFFDSTDEATKITNAIANLKTALNDPTLKSEEKAAELRERITVLRLQLRTLQGVGATFRETSAAAGVYDGELKEIQITTPKLADDTVRYHAAMTEVTRALRAQAQAHEEGRGAALEQLRGFESDGASQFVQIQNDLQAKIKQLQDIAFEFPELEGRANQAIEDLKAQTATQLADLGKVSAPVKQATEEISEYARQAARNMQDAFADFLFDPFDGGLKGMVEAFGNALRRMAAEAASARIFDAISGAAGSGGIAGFLGSLFGGGSSAGTAGPVVGAGLPPRAAGGPVSAGRAYQVGERGPEWFVPGMNGAIVPMGRSGGGNTFAPVYNIDARGSTPDSVVALRALLREERRQIKAEIWDQMDRRSRRIS